MTRVGTRLTILTGFLTFKIPFLDAYCLINLVGYVNKYHKNRLTTRFIASDISKNGILFVILPFETNLNFSGCQIQISLLGCLSDLVNASLSKCRHEKEVHLISNYKSLIIRKASKLCMKV